MAVNSMEFNGVRPAPNIQFGLAGDLRLVIIFINY